MSELTQKGIQALKSGDRSAARGLLAAAVKQDPNDAQAWLWLTGALDSDEERLACLRQVLRIDPTNQAAARGLAQIMERRKPAPAPPPEPPAPETAEGAAAFEDAATPEDTSEALDASASEESGAAAFEQELSADNAVAVPSVAVPKIEITPEALPDAPEAAPAPTGRKKRAAKSEDARRIFRTRPSLVPALAGFWLFLLGTVVLLALTNSTPGRILAAVVGVLLILIDLYVIISTMGTQYELTSQVLRLRSGRQKVSVPISDIYAVECRQSALQKLFGLGDVEMDTAAGGTLAHMRLRNIPNAKMRTEQLQYLVRDQA